MTPSPYQPPGVDGVGDAVEDGAVPGEHGVQGAVVVHHGDRPSVGDGGFDFLKTAKSSLDTNPIYENTKS